MNNTKQDKPALKESIAEPAWEPGVRRTTQEGQVLALSPLPVFTGKSAVDVNSWLRRKTDAYLDLQGGNLLFGAEFALMFLSLGLLSTAIFGFGITLAVGPEYGRWTWSPVILMVFLNLLISLPWGLHAHFLGNKAVKDDPPVRFHRQRREVAMPRWIGNSDFKIPFWNESAGLIAYMVIAFSIAANFTPFMLKDESPEYIRLLITIFLSVFLIEILVLGVYFHFALRLKKKHGPRLVYEIYPWEKLVAFIETKHNIGPNIMTVNTLLTLAIPHPDEPESALAAASINVGHESAGLAQWECIRLFMEEGADACPEPKNNETLANYKINCRQARKDMSFLAWIGKKIGDWFFQRYLAHIITERRSKVLSLRRMPAELIDWSESLPPSQWVKPSKELLQFNRQLAHVNQQRLDFQFAEMGPLSLWKPRAKDMPPSENNGPQRKQSRAKRKRQIAAKTTG